MRYIDPSGYDYDFWDELDEETQEKATAAYEHYQQDPDYFIQLYLEDPNAEEFTYSSIYCEYHPESRKSPVFMPGFRESVYNYLLAAQDIYTNEQIDEETCWSLIYPVIFFSVEAWAEEVTECIGATGPGTIGEMIGGAEQIPAGNRQEEPVVRGTGRTL